MIHLNIGKRLTEQLWETLRTSHRIKVKVHILDNDEDPVSSFQFGYGSDHLVAGAVQVDATQDVSRSLSLTILDPKGRLLFTPPPNPAHGTFFGAYFVRVKYCVFVPKHNLFPRSDHYPSPKHFPGEAALDDGGTWVEIPVFHGPITHLESNGPEMTLEAQGKESLALAPSYATKGFTLKKGERVDDAIKHVLNRVGETKYAIPSLPWKLKHDRIIHPNSEPWRVVAGGEKDSNGKKVNGLITRTGKHPHHVYYNGRGQVRVKRLNKHPVFTFDEDWFIDYPAIDYEGLDYVNRVVVKGVKPSGKGKRRAFGVKNLPKGDPLSPDNLSRNDHPGYRTLFVETDLKSDRQCRQRAQHVLNHQSHLGVEATFDILPIPMLEEQDRIRVKTDKLHVEYNVKQFTIPLVAGETMSVGYNKRISPRSRKKKRVRGEAGPGGRGGRGGRR